MYQLPKGRLHPRFVMFVVKKEQCTKRVTIRFKNVEIFGPFFACFEIKKIKLSKMKTKYLRIVKVVVIYRDLTTP